MLSHSSVVTDTVARLRRPSVIRSVIIWIMNHVPAVAVVADIAQGSVTHLHVPALTHASIPHYP